MDEQRIPVRANLAPEQAATLRVYAAAIAVLKAYGLPATCLAPGQTIDWHGTPEQRAALQQLHDALNAVLPPLP